MALNGNVESEVGKEVVRMVIVSLFKESINVMSSGGGAGGIVAALMRGGIPSSDPIKYDSLVSILIGNGKEKLFEIVFEDLLKLEFDKWTSLQNSSPSCQVFQVAVTNSLLILSLKDSSLVTKLFMIRPYRAQLLKIINETSILHTIVDKLQGNQMSQNELKVSLELMK